MVAHQESSAVAAAAFVASSLRNGASANGVLTKSRESDGPVANGVTIANAVANVENAFNELKKTIVNVAADSIVNVAEKAKEAEKVDKVKANETATMEEEEEEDEDYEEEEEEYEYPVVADEPDSIDARDANTPDKYVLCASPPRFPPFQASTSNMGRQVVTMKGYAYSGGGRRVTRVEITLDGGSTWRLCDITHPSPPTRHGKHWTWSLWATEVPLVDMVGVKEVAVRAWDEATNTQPDKLTWNVMGMMNNCWFRVRVAPTVTPAGSIALQFIHPTRPGNLPGGWMYDTPGEGAVEGKHLESLSVGDTIEIKGPLGHIEYLGRGNFLVSGEEKRGKKLAMLAGGTGITPIYQVAKAILADLEDKTEMWVLFGNRSVADVLLQDEMDRWVEQYPGRFHVWYTVCEPVPEGWKYGVGFVTATMANERLPRAGEDSLALMCGPPPMIRAMTPLLEGMGYTSDCMLTF
ncbi:unnamed protein product [Closterium sp. Yama58-4]|nr:unnamed protein product [Closterium sp. Yama58-4]